jgi:hypothetical protein
MDLHFPLSVLFKSERERPNGFYCMYGAWFITLTGRQQSERFFFTAQWPIFQARRRSRPRGTAVSIVSSSCRICRKRTGAGMTRLGQRGIICSLTAL